jgi:hypothetical protein
MSCERMQKKKNWPWLGIAAALGLAFTLAAFAQQAPQLTSGHDVDGPATWHTQGPATWRVQNGQVVGTVQGDGGWLVSNRGYQDVGVQFAFRCTGECQSGVLLGMEKQGDSTKGLYISLAPDDLSAYELTLNAQGQEVARTKFPENERGRGRGGRGGQEPHYASGQIGHPMAVPAPVASIQPNDWNSVEVRLYTPVDGEGQSLNVLVNGTDVVTGYPAPKIGDEFLHQPDRIALRPGTGRFGPLALRVTGSAGAKVTFKDVSIRSYTEVTPAVSKVSNRFRMQTVTPYFTGDGSCVADFNHDGHKDIAAGLVVWLGPDFKEGREIDVTYPMRVTDYGGTLSCQAADWTGDGWPDLVVSSFPGTGPVYLYVNPKNELRRWDRYKIIDTKAEIITMADIDRDGKPEFIFGGVGYDSAVKYAKPDPSDPTKPWKVVDLTEKGSWGPHGLGVGDVNGDGRLDVMRGWGWWEAPANPTDVPWKYHPEAFGRVGQGAGGGAEMFAYDVNGDGLNDVVTSLWAHGYGLAWFEQKRDKQGNISFVQHMIMDRDPSKSHGVAFSELHGLTLADVDGDGLKDIVTGKHRDHNLGGFHYNYSWPANEDAENVFYWFKLVRNPKAPGGAEFIPYMIHNNSGVGRQPTVVDLNNDGVMDIVNSGRFGTLIFWGKKGATDSISTTTPKSTPGAQR